MEYKRVLKDRKVKLSLLSSEMGEFDIEKIKKKIMGDKQIQFQTFKIYGEGCEIQIKF